MRWLPSLLLLASAPAHALVLVPECADWYMRQAGARLEFHCGSLSSQTPFVSFEGCGAATATRSRRTGTVTVTCNEGVCKGLRFHMLRAPVPY